MSWEEISLTQRKCPCGKGTYSIRVAMDDWNRMEDRWEMACPTCKQDYLLYTFYYYDSGMTCDSNIWVPRESLEELNSLKDKYAKAKLNIIRLFRSRYKDQWIGYFNKAKTKKRIWEKLTDNGQRYPSLSTFYSHVRGQSVTDYLTSAIDYHNLPFIIGKLGINDSNLNDDFSRIGKLEDAITGFEGELKRTGYR